MKNFVSLLLSVVLVFALVCTASAAATPDVSFDKETCTLSIGGGFGTAEHQPCMIYIYDASQSANDLSDSNPPVFADLAVTGAGGAFEYSKVLTDTYPSGKYRITVASANDSWSTEFMYTKKQSVTDLLGLINSQTSVLALEGVITANTTELGIDAEVYSPIKADVCTYLFGVKPTTGFVDADSFINSFDQCMAAARIKNGADASVVLKENAKALSIDFEEDYNKFDSNVKSAINTELKNAVYTENLLSELYCELRVVAFVKAAPTWQALKNAFLGVDASGNVIVSNYSVINPDVTVYNSVVNKDNVFAAMFKQKEKLISLENIRSIFASCALEVYNLERNGQGTSGGGSTGGGSAVSGPVTIQPGYLNQYTDSLVSALFTDTDTAAWYYIPLEKLVSFSLINGYEDKTFKPENSITRAEFTKLVVGVAEYTDTMVYSDGEVAFDDVASSDWFAPFVTKAAQAGLVTGANNSFNPNDLITRQDASVILYRLISAVKTIEGSANFSDADRIADYAKDAVTSLAGANIISGMGDGTFAPTQNLTRAQAAKLLYAVVEFLS